MLNWRFLPVSQADAYFIPGQKLVITCNQKSVRAGRLTVLPNVGGVTDTGDVDATMLRTENNERR